MDDRLQDEELNLCRSDKGKSHASWTWANKRIGMYALNGVLEAVFDDLSDAARNNKVGANYSGIHACINKKTKKHCNKIWRVEK